MARGDSFGFLNRMILPQARAHGDETCCPQVLPDGVAQSIREYLRPTQRAWPKVGRAVVAGFGGGSGRVHEPDGPEYTYHLSISADGKAVASVHRHGFCVWRISPSGDRWIEQDRVLLDRPGTKAEDCAPGSIPHRIEWIGEGSDQFVMISHSIRGGLQSAVVANKGSRLSLWRAPPFTALAMASRKPGQVRKRLRQCDCAACHEDFLTERRRRRTNDSRTVGIDESPRREEHLGLRCAFRVSREWSVCMDSPPATLSIVHLPPSLVTVERDGAGDEAAGAGGRYAAVCGFRDGSIRMWLLDAAKQPREPLAVWRLHEMPCKVMDSGVRVWDAASGRFLRHDIPVKGASVASFREPCGRMRHQLVVLLRYSRQQVSSTAQPVAAERDARAAGDGSAQSKAQTLGFTMAQPEPTPFHNTSTTNRGVVWSLDLGRGASGPLAALAVRRMSHLHDAYGKSLCIAHDGVEPFAISGSEGGRKNLLVHELRTGRLLRELRGHKNTVHALSVRRQWLASASRDGGLRLWRWREGECVKVVSAGSIPYPPRLPTAGQPDPMRGLSRRPPTVIATVIGPDCQWVAGGGHELTKDGKTIIRVWRRAGGAKAGGAAEQKVAGDAAAISRSVPWGRATAEVKAQEAGEPAR